MSHSVDDQGWITVKKTKKPKKTKKDNFSPKNLSTKVYNFNKSKSNPIDIPQRRYAPKSYKKRLISLEFKNMLQKARNDKKLTRKQLARRINESEHSISECENGTGNPSPILINKLNRALGIKLPKLKTITHHQDFLE